VARHSRLLVLSLPALVAGVTPGFAVVYLTVEQAQQAMLPGEALTQVKVALTAEQRKAIEKAAGVRVRQAELAAWKSASGTWFLVDEVIGKHEFITYAVTIDREGAVLGLEVLDYRETYGGEVRDPAWRAQFKGKTKAAALELGGDIHNISGATLSSRNLTNGVRRLLVTHDLFLRQL
jgi:Na+-translocating ferredoxin:NAD+ oxidoreductase RnfG subunit